MRITGGELKGRIIKCPDGIIRPAMDRMRESVFAVLGPLNGASFLDLFSGSGTIAIEAVSANVAVTEQMMHNRIRCHFMAVELFLKRCGHPFDYIFCDPPFPYKFHHDLIQTIADRSLITETGCAMIHRPAEKEMQKHIGGLYLSDQRVYGRSVVDFYRWNS